MRAAAISSKKEAILLLLCHDRGPPDPGMACDPIESAEFDHTGYDFVIIGSPVWAGRATPAINRRCSAHRMRRGRTIRMIRGTFNDEKMFTSAIAETRERR